MKKPACWITTALTLITLASPASAGDASHVQKLINKLCSACHGVEGNTTSPNFPKLAGQPAPYMEAQLAAFRDRTRSNQDAQDAMWGWTRTLTDQDIKDIAAYYAAQKPISGSPGPEALMNKGRQIFENGIPTMNVPACASCHGIEAQGKEAVPHLAGQHAAYLAKQLKIFRSADQRPLAVAMHTIVAGLTDEDIEAIAAYLQSK